MLKVIDVKSCDLLNGDGLRVSVWFAGCEHKCPGCQNPSTWEPEQGTDLGNCIEHIYDLVAHPSIQGITLSGGDPLYSPRREELLAFLKKFRRDFPSKDVWVWTGYTYDELIRDAHGKALLQYIDVLVDGRFVKEQLDIDLPWRGSSNQRVIDVPKSMDVGAVVLFCE